MKPLGRRGACLALAACAALVAGWTGVAQAGVEQFRLIKAIPADAYLTIHARQHAGMEFLEQQYARLWAELEKSRIDVNIKQVFKTLAVNNGATPEDFESTWQKLVDLYTAVDWPSLGDREYAAAMRMGFPAVEFVSLMMPPKDEVAASFDGLTAIVRELAAMSGGQVQVQTEGQGAHVVHKISAGGGAAMPMGLTLAREGEVILVGFGNTLPEQTLALLRGEDGESMADNPRFRAALARLPEPGESLSFFDASRMWAQMRTFVNRTIDLAAQSQSISAEAEGESGQDQAQQQTEQLHKLANAALNELDIFEYTAEVSNTQGLRTRCESIAVLKDDGQQKILYKVLYGNGTLSEPLKFVPKEASDFTVSAGINLQALYEGLAHFIETFVPNGKAQFEQALAQFNAATGLDLEQDVVGWIGGGFQSISVPGPTAYSNSDWIMMLSVRNEAKAREMIDRLFAAIQPMVQQQQGVIAGEQIEGTEGFRSVTLPQLVMFGLNKPTLGINDGWLFFASSPEMVRRILDTSTGKAPNVAASERFRKEGLMPEGHVLSVSFTDLTGLGQQLAQMLGMFGLAQMALPPEAAANPAVRALLGIPPKLARVARKLDFLQSKASVTTLDGKLVRTRSVVNYRKPPEPRRPKSSGQTGQKP